MIEGDTVKLLRECDAGIKMGISSIGDVLPSVKSEKFYQSLVESKEDHERMANEMLGMLESCNDDGKRPNPIAKSMSKMKTEMMLAMHRDDKTVADLITDGCNMGIKSLHKYLNRYEAASEDSRGIAKRLIDLEEDLRKTASRYL